MFDNLHLHLFLALLFTISCTCQNITGPLYAVGIVESVNTGFGIATYNLTQYPEPIVGYSDIPPLKGQKWGHRYKTRLDIDRNAGIAYIITTSLTVLGSDSVVILSYQYMEDGVLLANPKELTRCTYGKLIEVYSDIFVSSDGELWGFTESIDPSSSSLYKLSTTSCVEKAFLPRLPRHANFPVTMFLGDNNIYYTSDSSEIVQIDPKRVVVTRIRYPKSISYGPGSYFVLSQLTGEIFISTRDGRVNDQRLYWRFDPETRTISESQELSMVPGYRHTSLFDAAGTPMIVRLTRPKRLEPTPKWIAANTQTFDSDFWTFPHTLSPPFLWRLHTLKTN